MNTLRELDAAIEREEAAERALDRLFAAQLAELQVLCPPTKPRNPWLCSDEEYDTNAPASAPRQETGE